MGSALTPSVRPREEYLASAGMYHPWAGGATSPDCRLTPRRPGRTPDRRRASRRQERAYSPPWDILGAYQPRPGRAPAPSEGADSFEDQDRGEASQCESSPESPI
jgi:hypothetical protein